MVRFLFGGQHRHCMILFQGNHLLGHEINPDEILSTPSSDELSITTGGIIVKPSPDHLIKSSSNHRFNKNPLPHGDSFPPFQIQPENNPPTLFERVLLTMEGMVRCRYDFGRSWVRRGRFLSLEYRQYVGISVDLLLTTLAFTFLEFAPTEIHDDLKRFSGDFNQLDFNKFKSDDSHYRRTPSPQYIWPLAMWLFRLAVQSVTCSIIYEWFLSGIGSPSISEITATDP